MKILHLASFNRWTGATAPALAEVEALRRYGWEAYFAYVGGDRLERKLLAADYAHPLITKNQNPRTLWNSLKALADFVRRSEVNLVHAHLTYDHTLAVLLGRQIGSLRIARTFHSRRTLRRDPFTRFLLRHTSAVCVINQAFAVHPLIAKRQPLFTPPPVDLRVFHPQGPTARERLGIGAGVPVIGVIGKLARHRGFEEAITCFSIVQRAIPAARLVIIGHGPHQAALQRLAKEFSVDSSTIWAGYREEDLPDYLRSLDLMLFTREGSDEGHRAVSEAMACGVPVVCYPLPGIRPLVGSLANRLIASDAATSSLAAAALALLDCASRGLRDECVRVSALNRYEAAAHRLVTLYGSIDFVVK